MGYTQANLAFALAVEPENTALQNKQHQVDKLRQDGIPSIPTTLATELETNPFLRWDQPSVIAAAIQQGASNDAADTVFATIRHWKDNF